MATTEKILADAYGEIIDAEIEATVASADKDIPEMSAEFRKKMEELIRTGKPNNKKGLSKRGKRILIIAIAAVLALTLTACAVPEIRESIAGFFVKIFSDHVEYSDTSATKERIEDEYGIIPIPDGFVLTDTSSNDVFRSVVYTNENQTVIQLIQGAKGFIGESVDNENGEFSDYSIGDRMVRICYSEDYAQAAWIQDGYYFSLVYNSHIELEDLKALIENVRIV